MQEAVIVSGARTPIGRYGGAFKDVSAPELGSLAIKAALDQANVRPDQVDEVVLGNALQTAEAGAGTVTLVAVDLDTSGNDDTAIGSIEECVSISNGASHTFDLIVAQDVGSAVDALGVREREGQGLRAAIEDLCLSSHRRAEATDRHQQALECDPPRRRIRCRG
ncbi:MAG: hypothetical protein IIB29_11570 [Chloroflexi bacterium]|nr:hypothetical protein [Chloroflexota bacterium]